MKKFFFFLLFLPATLFAQVSDAVSFVDRVIAALKKDAIVEMSYSYKVYDDAGKMLQDDSGVMILDGERYALLMDEMKVWCDGKSQWSYMEGIDEIYVTDAGSDEAQNMSPLYIMETCRDGYGSSMKLDGNNAVVTLVAQGGEGVVDEVEFAADIEKCRLQSMKISLSGQGYIIVDLDNYKANCKFDNTVFECPVKDFPTAVVVDMR